MTQIIHGINFDNKIYNISLIYLYLLLRFIFDTLMDTEHALCCRLTTYYI